MTPECCGAYSCAPAVSSLLAFSRHIASSSASLDRVQCFIASKSRQTWVLSKLAIMRCLSGIQYSLMVVISELHIMIWRSESTQCSGRTKISVLAHTPTETVLPLTKMHLKNGCVFLRIVCGIQSLTDHVLQPGCEFVCPSYRWRVNTYQAVKVVQPL
jgi:hypothetical protein